MFNQWLDKDYLRLPTKNKKPLRKDWSIPVNHYYKEPQNISQLLQEHGEYSIRLGKLIAGGYYLCALIFRFPDKKFNWLNYFANLLPEVSYTTTENGLYYWLLIKELPPTCALKTFQQELVGALYSDGRTVVGAGSKIDNFIYQWQPRKLDYWTCETFRDLQTYLISQGLQIIIQGAIKVVKKGTTEIIIPRKLKARWKRRELAKTKQEKRKSAKPPKKAGKAKRKKQTIKTTLPKIGWKQCPKCQGRYKNKHYRCLVKCQKCQKRVREKKLKKHIQRFHE